MSEKACAAAAAVTAAASAVTAAASAAAGGTHVRLWSSRYSKLVFLQ